jgi:hypothetical protein
MSAQATFYELFEAKRSSNEVRPERKRAVGKKEPSKQKEKESNLPFLMVCFFFGPFSVSNHRFYYHTTFQYRWCVFF